MIISTLSENFLKFIFFKIESLVLEKKPSDFFSSKKSYFILSFIKLKKYELLFNFVKI